MLQENVIHTIVFSILHNKDGNYVLVGLEPVWFASIRVKTVLLTDAGYQFLVLDLPKIKTETMFGLME